MEITQPFLFNPSWFDEFMHWNPDHETLEIHCDKADHFIGRMEIFGGTQKIILERVARDLPHAFEVQIQGGYIPDEDR